MYTSIYTENLPVLVDQLVNTAEMQRLADIGMHCGCEYPKFPLYLRAGASYSRLIHSVGVAKIVWNFTHDLRQTAAGLFHDIATPVFAHTVDFMQGDHMTQEATGYIDPLVLVGNSPRRLTAVEEGIRDQLQSFLKLDFNYWMFAV